VKRISALLALAVLAGIALPACGGAGHSSPGEVAVEFTEALIDKDGDRACDLMTAKAKQELLKAGVLLGGGSCGELIEKAAEFAEGDLAKKGDQEIASETIKGDTAVVKLKGATDAIHLRKVDGEWLVDADPDEEDDSTASPDDETGETTGSDDPESCQAKGINPEQLRTGTCTDAGVEYTVANRDGTVTLPDIKARLDGYRIADSVSSEFDSAQPQSGTFVIADLAVTNRGTQPGTLTVTDMARLRIGDRQWDPDFDVTQVADDTDASCIYEDLGPGIERKCSVVFEVPEADARKIETPAAASNLLVVGFSEDFDSPDHVGAFRLYH
jgi:hypothetical protein